MENVISFTFANWITVLLMAGIAILAFLVVTKGTGMLMSKFASKSE